MSVQKIIGLYIFCYIQLRKQQYCISLVLKKETIETNKKITSEENIYIIVGREKG